MSSTRSLENSFQPEVKPARATKQPWQKWRVAQQKIKEQQEVPHYWWDDMS